MIHFFPKLIFANNLLEKIDAYRNPSQSYVMKIKITSSTNKEVSEFQVYLKGHDKTLIKVLSPSKNIGKNMLMIKENMWVYIPNIKRSVRVSLSQKLTGEAANGDISRMRWNNDYNYEVTKKDKNEIELYLTEKKKGLTYPKIKIWVSAQDLKPLRAEFLTLSNKTLKTASYLNYKNILGMKRPTQIHIVDHLKKNNFSDIYILEMKNKVLPDTLFHERNLK